MKKFKRILRVCGLILFMLMAASGISIFGIAPTLNRDGKLFTDQSTITETREDEQSASELDDEKN